jgi:hypothetical protein
MAGMIRHLPAGLTENPNNKLHWRLRVNAGASLFLYVDFVALRLLFCYISRALKHAARIRWHGELPQFISQIRVITHMRVSFRWYHTSLILMG